MGVLQGAGRSMTYWPKDEEEASRQRAIKRGDDGPKNSLDTTPTNGTGGGRVKTAREESKRKEADRVARYVADRKSVLCGYHPSTRRIIPTSRRGRNPLYALGVDDKMLVFGGGKHGFESRLTHIFRTVRKKSRKKNVTH